MRAIERWAIIGSIAGVVSAVVAVLSFQTSHSPSLPTTATMAPPSVPSTSPVITSNKFPTLSRTEQEPPPTEIVLYLDDYVRPCGIAGSIQRTGAANINGITYLHTISQTANGYTGTNFYLARRVHRFQATVGPTDQALTGHRMQFQLRSESGATIFDSNVLGVGQTQPVDVSVEGVLKLFLIAKTVGPPVGGQGTAGWGDARVTTTSTLSCP